MLACEARDITAIQHHGLPNPRCDLKCFFSHPSPHIRSASALLYCIVFNLPMRFPHFLHLILFLLLGIETFLCFTNHLFTLPVFIPPSPCLFNHFCFIFITETSTFCLPCGTFFLACNTALYGSSLHHIDQKYPIHTGRGSDICLYGERSLYTLHFTYSAEFDAQGRFRCNCKLTSESWRGGDPEAAYTFLRSKLGLSNLSRSARAQTPAPHYLRPGEVDDQKPSTPPSAQHAPLLEDSSEVLLNTKNKQTHHHHHLNTEHNACGLPSPKQKH